MDTASASAVLGNPSVRGTSALTGKRHPQRTTHGRILARTRAGICSSASPCFMLTLTSSHGRRAPPFINSKAHGFSGLSVSGTTRQGCVWRLQKCLS